MTDERGQEGSVPRTVHNSTAEDQVKDGKTKKRSLFGLGKKKVDNSKTPSLPKESSQLSSATRSTASPPSQSDHVFAIPTSPNRALSTSPRISSPARSQIFERDVQDSTVLPANSPAIPTHIQTENHIPPVLDDASEAITNNKLDPDTVEIITHNSHQPAAVTVTGIASPTASTPYDQPPTEWADELASFANRDNAVLPDSASNYGSLDSADVRRLSFISFADVVQSEHGGMPGPAGSRDSIHMAGLTTLPSAAMNRSPSPIRSPVSSQGPGTSPPTSNPGSIKGIELSPSRKPLGSPGSASQTLSPSGDLNIETMSQALRRTGSTELGALRSLPNSPIEGPTLR